MRQLLAYTKGDRTIWLVVIFLAIFSLLAVYSSTGTLAYKQHGGNTSYYLFKHGFLLAFGIVLMYGAHKIRYTFYLKIATIALLLAIPLLALTLVMGTNLNEASRWITVPVIGISFQTSDFAKLALIIYVSKLLSQKQGDIKDFRSAFVPVIVPIILICALILPANLSTAAVLFSTCLTMMFIGRIAMKYIAGLVGIGIIVFALFIGIALLAKKEGRIGTWKKRIENFSGKNEEGNYQSIQAKIAIAKGGTSILGVKPGNSTQRNFLPHPYSDFIYAIICEEYGFGGALLIMVLYLILFFRGVRIIRRSPKAFASMLAFGCSFSLVFQAMINMAVATNLFPVTGQPLPLLSMGGTSIWFTSISIGILLSVSRDVEKEEKEVANV